MSNLLIFFALPLATIIIAIVLEKVWKNYILVTLLTFAIYLIVAFALGDANLLVLVIIYTFLAFIASFLSMLFRRLNHRLRELENENGRQQNRTINATTENAINNNCRCDRNNQQNVELNATLVPNNGINGRTGTFRGQYRRNF